MQDMLDQGVGHKAAQLRQRLLRHRQARSLHALHERQGPPQIARADLVEGIDEQAIGTRRLPAPLRLQDATEAGDGGVAGPDRPKAELCAAAADGVDDLADIVA
jgi:hypothetical protein